MLIEDIILLICNVIMLFINLLWMKENERIFYGR